MFYSGNGGQQRAGGIGHIHQAGVFAIGKVCQRRFHRSSVPYEIDCIAEWHGHLTVAGTRHAGAGQIPGRFRLAIVTP
jgi:hypothetical protein